jgi:HipA-like protein
MRKHRKPLFAPRHSGAKRSSRGRPLNPVVIKRWTGHEPDAWPVPALRSGRFYVDERQVGGDAPKDFIWVYSTRRGGVCPRDWRKWPAFIAKVGHQFYPAESVTEQLITRIGQILGLQIADSRLMICAQQIRFMSRYFLSDEEILNHGAEILEGYLADKDFVGGVAAVKAEKSLFTFQVFCTAICAGFPNDHAEILQGFVRMIGFDALVGNQDRHFYNWGVITHPTGAARPRFAPIYDTARGLFWNTTEEGLARFSQAESLTAYIRNSRPEIGWDGWKESNSELRHFDLVDRVAASDKGYWRLLEDLGRTAMASLAECEGMIDAEFDDLLSAARRGLIKRCLRVRFQKYSEVF